MAESVHTMKPKEARDQNSLGVAALFAGIGGVELGMHRTGGFHTELFAENDAGACAVLNDRFTAQNHGDIRDLTKLPRGVSVLTAGFPCQDLSQAGRTRGIRGQQSGLVSHVFKLLRSNPLNWVVIENVPFMLQLERGGGIRYLTRELEQLGYHWAYRVIDTRAFGLPQRRRRVFLVASQCGDPAKVLFRADAIGISEDIAAPADAFGFYWTEGNRGLGWAPGAVPTLKGGSGLGIPSPPAVWLKGKGIFTPSIEVAERLQGFPAGWTKAAARATKDSLRWKLVGNAVTVDVAEWVAEGIVGAQVRRRDLKSRPQATDAGWSTAGLGGPGTDPWSVDVSEFPERRPLQDIGDFLGADRKPLSLRATAGFINRFAASRLRKPEGFLEALRLHHAQMLEIDARRGSFSARRSAGCPRARAYGGPGGEDTDSDQRHPTIVGRR